MKLHAIPFVIIAALSVTLLAPHNALAQRDPETAARQAEIDADEARSKIEDLQQEQIAAADVQNENTGEMAARDNLIQEYQDQEYDAERRLRAAESQGR